MSVNSGGASDWSDAEVARVVAAIMRNDHALSQGGRQDRYAVDGLIHTYRALSAQPDARKRIGEAVAGYLRTGTTMERAIALSFYNANMSAWGGEALGELASENHDGFEASTPVPIGGVTGKSMREALLYAAFSWNGGEGVTAPMLAIAKQDALTGDGEAFLKDLARNDAAWFAQHEHTFLSLYDKGTAAVWRARVEAGADPMETLAALMPSVTPRGRVPLQMTIRFYRGVDAEQKGALMAALEGEPTPADQRHTVTLKEATAGKLGSVRVGCGNFWNRDFTSDSGATVSKMSAKLAPFGSDSIVVYQGMEIVLGDVTWRVDGFSEGADGRGRVELSSSAR